MTRSEFFQVVREWTRARKKRIGAIAIFYLFFAFVAMPFFDLRGKASHVMPEVWGILDATMRGARVAASNGADLVPVILVDVDEESAKKWGFHGRTRRDRLTQVLEVISRAHPAAIVVDIDLSDDPNCPCIRDDPGDVALQNFIAHYHAKAPLVFIKRTQQGSDGRLTMAPSPYDPLFARSSSTTWAQAHFVPDADGVTRRWVESIGVCGEQGPTRTHIGRNRASTARRWPRCPAIALRPSMSPDRAR